MRINIIMLLLIVAICESCMNELSHPTLCNQPKKIAAHFNSYKDSIHSGLFVEPIEITGDFKSEHVNVDNYANLMVRNQFGHLEDLSSIYNHELRTALKDGISARVILSKNETFCEHNLLDIHKDARKIYIGGILVHIWENPDSTKSDTLYVIYNYPTRPW